MSSLLMKKTHNYDVIYSHAFDVLQAVLPGKKMYIMGNLRVEKKNPGRCVARGVRRRRRRWLWKAAMANTGWTAMAQQWLGGADVSLQCASEQRHRRKTLRSTGMELPTYCAQEDSLRLRW